VPIKVKYLKYLFMVPGLVLLYTVLADKNWELLSVAIFAIIVGGLLGYGAERLWLYINRNPGGTRRSKFWIGK
jgi:hypothetical protein